MAADAGAIFALMMSAAILAGVQYSAGGYLKNIRRHIAGDADPMDWGKMGRAVLNGVILGIVAGALVSVVPAEDNVITGAIHEFLDPEANDGTPHYTDPAKIIGVYVMIVPLMIGYIHTADKYLGGRANGKGKGDGDVPPATFDNNLPPPKGDAA